ncbi:hypothetical protein [Pseudoclavibacter caeni]|jgi:hypothetical protein|uniref:Uncharacterized protein n=1 Tax=Pseudoclavibacter caeni TaxID=908846 RepID=A0A7C8BME6_9MICO|nr:hypothetical protein [Pseudoclavibacter caeni]KAB1631237.1 hypothetical protein F8O02_08520 [Pseudoclavibacter caeni]NYJ96670.1 hypothetical protein [Pseudoclavibacter caeni]
MLRLDHITLDDVRGGLGAAADDPALRQLLSAPATAAVSSGAAQVDAAIARLAQALAHAGRALQESFDLAGRAVAVTAETFAAVDRALAEEPAIDLSPTALRTATGAGPGTTGADAARPSAGEQAAIGSETAEAG